MSPAFMPMTVRDQDGGPPRYEFRFRAGYLGGTDFDVFGDGPAYVIALRRDANGYERSIYNHASDPHAWERDVIASIGLVHRSGSVDRPIPAAVVDAFNDWQAQEHASLVAAIKAAPDRYGELSDDDPLFDPPRPVRGAHYEAGKGWVAAAAPAPRHPGNRTWAMFRRDRPDTWHTPATFNACQFRIDELEGLKGQASIVTRKGDPRRVEFVVSLVTDHWVFAKVRDWCDARPDVHCVEGYTPRRQPSPVADPGDAGFTP